LTLSGFADNKNASSTRECLYRFSLLKASTETKRVASSISVGAFYMITAGKSTGSSILIRADILEQLVYQEIGL
jgi:hypothetical protein